MTATPQVVARHEWGALEPTGPYTVWVPGQPTGHTDHWEGAGGHSDHSQCPAEVRSIQLFHMHNGYFDIAYHWIVCMHGVVFQGRPIDKESAAQRDGNRTHIAICYMAGPAWPLTLAAKIAIAWLNTLNAPPVAIPHADEPSCSTSCAGPEVNPWVRSGDWKNFVPVHSPVTQPPPPAPAPTPNPLPPGGFHHPVLGINTYGPAVHELQHDLNIVAGQGLVEDGHFGPRTQAAVRNVQTFFRITSDGIAGPKTWGILDYVIAAKHLR